MKFLGLPKEKVVVPEWGTVFVQAISVDDSLYLETLPSETEEENLQLLLAYVVRSVVDKDGKPVFTDSDKTDIRKQTTLQSLLHVRDVENKLRTINLETLATAKKN